MVLIPSTSKLLQMVRQGLGRDDSCSQCLQNFAEAQALAGAYESVNRGLVEVPLDRIIGTVGRYNDFDRYFRPKRQGTDERYIKIRQAMQEGKELPPINLYQIKDDYFIVDGHHRFTAAREMGRSQLQACVLELLPSADTLENQLYREMITFRDQAGLAAAIDLTEPGQYGYLEKQISIHQEYLDQEQPGITYQQAAVDWYRTIYHPLATLIERNDMLHSFPARTVADLYLYISVHQWQQGRQRRYGREIDALIPGNMEDFRKKMADHTASTYPEMKREITVFVLLNVEGKHEQRIMDKLMALDEVCEIYSVHGAIDIIVKATLMRDLLASDAELISQFTHGSIRTMRGVQSTQTLIPGLSIVKPKKNVS